MSGEGGEQSPITVQDKIKAVDSLSLDPTEIESIRPIPGTVSPRTAVRTPSGPSSTTVPPRTSRTVQPSIVVGLVSGTGTIGSRAVRVALVALAESTERRVPPGDVASALAKGAPAGELTAGGVCRPDGDAVLRAPSLLPLDLISADRREGISV